jgi:hypothetical protein
LLNELGKLVKEGWPWGVEVIIPGKGEEQGEEQGEWQGEEQGEEQGEGQSEEYEELLSDTGTASSFVSTHF